MNTPVSIPIANLLKEKSFDRPVHQYYQFIRDLSSKKDKTWQLINSSFLVRESDASMFPDEGKNGIEMSYRIVSAYSDRIFRDYNFKTSEDFISAPTIAEVVMWLYEKHGIWIEVSYMDDVLSFGFNICTLETNTVEDEQWKFTSPTEAYSSAIEYTLKNLI